MARSMAQYTRNPPLDHDQLDAAPVIQLTHWIEDAAAAGMQEPTAMTLATVDGSGRPSARVVLYKGLHGNAPVFYTHYDSRKAQALAANPKAALVFWWDKLERQVRLEGTVEKVPRAVTEAYFATRPRASQISAAVSRQSQPVASRAALDARMAKAEAHFGDGPIPCPEEWGGYCLVPDVIEFWQGRLGRAHDRLRYTRETPTAAWHITRLEP